MKNFYYNSEANFLVDNYKETSQCLESNNFEVNIDALKKSLKC